ncbi:hypothetical protein B0H63DRAFT_486672 [Podospora didyma]|uniref:F-box domain-containing protein n=1 Tax=Podospora didyma TaxID=330526 RepID=A0AAE0N4V8_9PEZI|nr:hypothetical protein B0H63DRAFT_486672 [Podospora didyma]
MANLNGLDMANGAPEPLDPHLFEDEEGDDEFAWQLRRVENMLTKGRALMSKAQYPGALKSLMEAVSLCPCEPDTHGKDKSCNILQCITAVQDSDPDALYNVVQGPCSCGFEWPSCTYPRHIETLDTMAECLEGAQAHVAAFSTALGLIRLDPASPVGYCRIAKIIRYLVRRSGSDTKAAKCLAVVLRDGKLASKDKLRDMLQAFVKSGLHNMEKYRHSYDDKHHVILRKMAHNLKMPQSRRDPIKKLPREIFSMILMYLNFPELICCLLVNKHWNQVCVKDSALWRDLRLTAPRNPGRQFGTFLQKHSNMRTLVIENIDKLPLNPKRMDMISFYLPNLECLRLGSPRFFPSMGRFEGVPGKQLAKLTQLSLVGIEQESAGLLEKLLQLTHTSLEVLDLAESTSVMEDFFLHHPMPKLKKLSLHFSTPGSKDVMELDMNNIVMSTPNLESLSMNGYDLRWNDPDQFPFAGDQKAGQWQSLRSICFGEDMELSRGDPDIPASRCLPPLNKNMKAIEILCSDLVLIDNVLFTADSDSNSDDRPLHPTLDGSTFPFESLGLPHLELFRCAGRIDPRLLRHVLMPACKNGTLQVLELTEREKPRASRRWNRTRNPWAPPSFDSVDPVVDLAFAFSDSVHTLGLSWFNWAAEDNHYSAFDGQPFMAWLDHFPNVRTVTVHPGPCSRKEPVVAFILKLLTHANIKVLHQNVLIGTDWDAGQKIAKKRGILLDHTLRFETMRAPFVE